MPVPEEAPDLRTRLRETFGPILAGVFGGGLTGLSALTLVAPLCRNVAESYSHFPGLEAPLIAVRLILPLWMTPLAVVVAFLGLLAVGPLVVRLVRPRDRWADLSAGLTAGLAAAATTYTLTLGWPAVLGTVVVPTIADMTYLTGSGVTPESMAERYPDLGTVEPEKRGGYLMAKVISDQAGGGAIGVWIGVFLSLMTAGTLGVGGALAAGYLRRRNESSRVPAWSYLGLTVPISITVVQFALAIITAFPQVGHENFFRPHLIPLLGTIAFAGLCAVGVVRRWPATLQVPVTLCWFVLLVQTFRQQLPWPLTEAAVVLTGGLIVARLFRRDTRLTPCATV